MERAPETRTAARGQGGAAAAGGLESVDCAICGVSDSLPLFPARDKMFPGRPERFAAVRCRRCGLVYLNPRPAAAARLKHYGGQYRFTAGHSEQSQSLQHYLPVISFLERQGRGSVLDVGTGNSPFLPEMRRHGWQVSGTEVDASLVAWFRDELAIELHAGELADARLAGGSVDAITIMGVLEHVPDPRRLLAECSRILRDGGVLALWCFNRSVEAALLGRHWLGFDTPRHLYSFSGATLARLLAETGFSVEEEYFRPMNYLAYSGLWAAGRLRGWMASDCGPVYLPRLPRVLELAGLPWGAALARLRRSSNIYVFARKRT